MEHKLFEDISAVEGKVVLKFDLGENTEHVINIILRHKQPTTPSGGCTYRSVMDTEISECPNSCCELTD